jgi:hypothetical protein
LLVGLLLADEMRRKSLGLPPQAWDETLTKYGVFTGVAIALMRGDIGKEATN